MNNKERQQAADRLQEIRKMTDELADPKQAWRRLDNIINQFALVNAQGDHDAPTQLALALMAYVSNRLGVLLEVVGKEEEEHSRTALADIMNVLADNWRDVSPANAAETVAEALGRSTIIKSG